MSEAAARLRMNERSARRHRVKVITAIRSVGSADVDLQIDSISAIGFSGRTEGLFRRDEDVIVHLPIIGDMAARLAWVKGDTIAGEFARTIDANGLVAELTAI